MATVVSRTGELIDDMVIRDAECTPHVLNAVSPGLTCSLPSGRDVAERAKRNPERKPRVS